MLKKLCALLLALCLCIGMVGCGVPSYYMDMLEMGQDLIIQMNSTPSSPASQQGHSVSGSNQQAPAAKFDLKAIEMADRGDKNQTWAIYWYLCGSDLESRGGYATYDLMEMMEAELSENVRVVIQTGGSSYWHNNTISAGNTERYLYDSKGLHLLERKERANMGDSETLADFLSFCTENYPADKTMVLLWDHGGGSVNGAVYDQNYGNDRLSLGEFYEAFNEAFELSNENPPIDVVGFDACLMATVDVAFTFCDAAKYLVASEELEPGKGWDYGVWLQELSKDPGMGGAKLGKIICDSYKKDADSRGEGGQITLSVTDLRKLQPLLEAYDAMGQEALTTALEDPSFFTSFARQATRSESYGGNNNQEGYTNMVDLGHLARNSAELLPDSAGAVLDGLSECVIYRVNGAYRSQATGLSCYYSFNGNRKDLAGYNEFGYSKPFKYLYSYGLDGQLSSEGMAYVNGLGYEQEALPEVPSFESEDFSSDFPLSLSEEGYAMLDIGPKLASIIKGVYFHLAFVSTQGDTMLLLGRDNDIDADFLNGIFLDNFRGVWGSIDGHFVYMEIIYEGEDYNIYAVPILLNGEACNLRVAYDYNTEEYYILGARRGLEDTGGLPDKDLMPIYVGDTITTILYATDFQGNAELKPYKGDSFTVKRNTSFYEQDLGDGEFILLFELVDSKNNSIWSDPAYIEVHGEDIYVMVDEH